MRMNERINIHRSLPAHSKWRHYKTMNDYTIVGISNTFADDQERYPATVVYKASNGQLWSMPYSKWHNSFVKID